MKGCRFPLRHVLPESLSLLRAAKAQTPLRRTVSNRNAGSNQHFSYEIRLAEPEILGRCGRGEDADFCLGLCLAR